MIVAYNQWSLLSVFDYKLYGCAYVQNKDMVVNNQIKAYFFAFFCGISWQPSHASKEI